MKELFAKWASLNKRARVLVSIVGVIVLLLIVTAAALVFAGDYVSDLAGGLFGASGGTAHLHPDSPCIAVGQTLQFALKGAEFKGAGFWSDDESIVDSKGHGEIVGKGVGKTKVRIGGAAHLVTWGWTDVTVKKDLSDCWNAPEVNNSSATSFKFIFVSDTQGAWDSASLGNPKTPVDDDFAKWFAAAMTGKTNAPAYDESKQGNLKEKPAFVVNGGDLASLGTYAKDWINDVAAIRDAGIPIYAVVGNHDLTEAATGTYVKVMQNKWQNDLWEDNYFTKGGKRWPSNGQADYKNLFYSFQYGNSLFVFTDDFLMWGGDRELMNDKFTYDNGYYSDIGPYQAAWVDRQIQFAKANNLKHAFGFGHVPLLPDPNVDNIILLSGGCGLGLLPSSNPVCVFDGYFGGHTRGLELTSVPRGLPNVKQPNFLHAINETGETDRNPNCYLRVEVQDNKATITPVCRSNDGKVTEGAATGQGPLTLTK